MRQRWTASVSFTVGEVIACDGLGIELIRLQFRFETKRCYHDDIAASFPARKLNLFSI